MMQIVIDTKRRTPASSQLAHQIRQAILRGEIGPWEALPSARQLANDLELDGQSVAEAYRSLEGESVLRRRSIRGPLVDPAGRNALRQAAEMSLARDIHDTLVQPVRFANRLFEALGSSRPSGSLGGDLIDLVDHGKTSDLFLADVSGHGAGAGLVMAMIKSSLRTGLRRTVGLSTLLADLNAVLHDTTASELYATAACLRVHAAGSRIEYALAGHHPILHHRATTAEVRELDHRNLPIGLFEDRTYTTETVLPESGDLFVIYTDGLNEIVNPAGQELGHAAIARTIATTAKRPLEEIHRAVLETASSHGPQTDDRSLLLVRWRS